MLRGAAGPRCIAFRRFSGEGRSVTPAEKVPARLSVLFVEDDPLDAELLLTQLRAAGFEVSWRRVDTEPAFLEQLELGADLVLADYRLPAFSGLRALRLLRARDREMPFIMVSGSIGDESAAECIREGANDYVLKDRLGRLGAAVASAIESRRLQQTLLRERELMRTLIDQSPDPIYVKDRDSRFVLANAAVARMYGVATPAALLGRTDADFIPRELARSFRADEERVLAGEPHVNREERVPLPGGGSRILLTSKMPLRDSTGQVTNLVGIGRDITERKVA
ncbi:MAG TPA: PAS domain-containing protein, partial [Opitutaceae bacterium]|nr:PAS domain-containing protein [Opitutaceae bacterium]